MKILSIETSCDETAVALVECTGGVSNPRFEVLGNKLFTQMNMHKEYGGVYPMLAKREHAKNLVPVLIEVLKQAKIPTAKEQQNLSTDMLEEVKTILEREPDMADALIEALESGSLLIEVPFDAIAVTVGPGLEPALWVGINFARALSLVWSKPVIAVNHMEGHLASVLVNSENVIHFPLLALLVSGGHTELVLSRSWGEYTKIGQKRDDAVGEAFDKVARMLGLPYPGGPEISKLAMLDRERRTKKEARTWNIPRPMINSGDYDFSFSGVKTSVLYTIQKIPTLTEVIIQEIAREFEDGVIDVLIKKTETAILEFNPKSLIVGGGVIANKELRRRLTELCSSFEGLALILPDTNLATDNAIMIAAAGYLKHMRGTSVSKPEELKATGKLSLELS